jgi:hypothetical protein
MGGWRLGQYYQIGACQLWAGLPRQCPPNQQRCRRGARRQGNRWAQPIPARQVVGRVLARTPGDVSLEHLSTPRYDGLARSVCQGLWKARLTVRDPTIKRNDRKRMRQGLLFACFRGVATL